MYSINDLIREGMQFQVEEFDSIIDFYDFYYSLDEESKDFLMRLLISDCCINYLPELPKFYKEADSIEEIILEAEENNKLMLEILSTAMDFSYLTYVDKQLQMQMVNHFNLNKEMQSIFKGHILDQITYKKKYSLDEMKYSYNDFISINGDTKETRDVIISFLMTDIIYLMSKNENKYKKIILELVKDYYLWEKYFVDNVPLYIGLEEIEIIDIIENNSIDTIIEVLNSRLDLIRELLFKYVSSNHVDEELRKIVFEYCNSESSEVVKKLSMN